MARIEQPDGSEVITDDEEPPRRERRRFPDMRKKPNGKTGRQNFEAGVKKIVGKMWDYASGEGDDLDRALRMTGLKEGEPESKIPYDSDFD